MKSISKQLNEATAHIALTEAEKVRMREQLVAYMEYKPIRTPGAESRATKKASTHSFFPFFRTHHFSGAFLIAGLVASSTFGVSFAAGEALPGDFLYNVKVNVNEEVRSAFLNTKESQIAWERERAERRLIEASKLASEGRLTAENKEKVSKLFAEHTEAVVQGVRDIEAQDPLFALEASSDLGESLDAHEAVLARLIVENEASQGQDARDLVEQVRTTSMEVEKIREDAQENMPVEEPGIAEGDEQEEPTEEDVREAPATEEEKTESANMRIRATERAHERATDLLEKIEKQVLSLEEGSDLYMQTKTQIEHGKEFLQTGEEALRSYEYGTAYNAFRQAENSFEKVHLLLEVQQLFSIEIYTNHNENESTEEGEAVVEELNTVHIRIKDEIQEARALLLTRSGHGIETIEKANSLIKDGEARMLQGEISMVLSDHDSARDFFSRAHTHVSRAMTLLEKEDESSAVEELPILEEEKEPEEQPVQNEKGEEISITHTFSEGVHTYTGVLSVPTPCHTLEQTARVAESFPEQITLVFSSIAPEADIACIQVVSEETFSVSVEASSEANLVGITLDDRTIPFVLTGSGNGDGNATGSAPERADGGTTSTHLEGRGGLFERAVETTQSFFLP